MSDGYKTAMIVNKLFDIECSTDEAIELEHLMWGTQICRTCAGNSVGDYAIRIKELEQQLQQTQAELARYKVAALQVLR